MNLTSLGNNSFTLKILSLIDGIRFNVSFAVNDLPPNKNFYNREANATRSLCSNDISNK